MRLNPNEKHPGQGGGALKKAGMGAGRGRALLRGHSAARLRLPGQKTSPGSLYPQRGTGFGKGLPPFSPSISQYIPASPSPGTAPAVLSEVEKRSPVSIWSGRCKGKKKSVIAPKLKK